MNNDQFSIVGKIMRFGVLPACLMLSVAHFAAGPALAEDPPAPASSACDPDYYDSLESRAWLEAQREIVQNQNLIVKPDSVLQYTCFDKHLGAIEKATEQMFSHEKAPTGISGLSALGGTVGGLLGNTLNGGGLAGSLGGLLGSIGDLAEAANLGGLADLANSAGLNLDKLQDLLDTDFDFTAISDALTEGLDLGGLADKIKEGLNVNALGDLFSENFNFDALKKITAEGINLDSLKSLSTEGLQQLSEQLSVSVSDLTKVATAAGKVDLSALSSLGSADALKTLGAAAASGTNLGDIAGLSDLASTATAAATSATTAVSTVTGAVTQATSAYTTVTNAISNPTSTALGIVNTASPSTGAAITGATTLYNTVTNTISNPTSLLSSDAQNFVSTITNPSAAALLGLLGGTSTTSTGGAGSPATTGTTAATTATQDLATGGTTASAIAAAANASSGEATAIAASATSSYLLANFTGSTSTFLGGRSSSSYQPAGVVPAAYSCNVMDSVWKEARCSDFIDIPATDGFFTLAEYASPGSQDRRFPLGSCSQSGNWSKAYGNVFEKEYSAILDTGPKWTRDTAKSYLEAFEREDGDACSGSQIIATGIIVQQKDAQPGIYNQKMCLMPGCDYVPTSLTAGDCKKFEG